MGTNFYWYEKEDSPCPHCGRSDERERLHIGKSSAGWCFSLQVLPDEGINGLDDWREKFAVPGSVIADEYGEALTPEEMLGRITKREWRPFDTEGRWDDYGSEAEFHRRNHSMRGPNGLLRSRIDGNHCVGHGEGTFDLLASDFT